MSLSRWASLPIGRWLLRALGAAWLLALPPAAQPQPLGPVDLFARLDPAADLLTRSWIDEVTGSSALRTVVPGRSPAVLLVLAGDLELPSESHRLEKGPGKHLVLLGDEVRLTDRLALDLSGSDCGRPGRVAWRDRPSGGHLVLLARRLVCEPNGQLRFVSRGGKSCTGRSVDKRTTSEAKRPTGRVRDKRNRSSSSATGRSTDKRSQTGRSQSVTFPGGDGGILFVAAEQYVLGEHEVTPEEFLAQGCLQAATPGGAGPRPGKPGGVRAVTGLASALSELGPLGAHAMSKWVLAVLYRATTEIRSADLAAGRIEAARRLAEALRLSDHSRYPVLPEDEETYRERLGELTELRDRLSGSLWRESLSLPTAGGVPRPIELWTSGKDLRTRAAPTDALVLGRRVAGRHVLGLMELDPDRPDRLRLELEAELRLDPWIGSRIARTLAGRGEDFAGVFADWTLEGREIEYPGIVDSRVAVGGDGRTVRVSLTLETDRASLVLAQLSSSAGLPLVFDWGYRHDRNLRGTWEGPPLTLRRRADPRLVVDAIDNRTVARVTNVGEIEQTLEYLQAGDAFLPLAKALTLFPGETADLPLPLPVDAADATGIDLSALSIPATAVLATGTDPFRAQSAFQAVSGEELLERVTVTNHLGHDDRFGGGLEYVEIELAYSVQTGSAPGGGGADEIAAGPYRLAPRGAKGSEITVSWIKPRPGAPRIRITGTAYYEGGSRQTLAPTTVSDLWIHLTEDFLRSPSTAPSSARERVPSIKPPSGKELP